MELSCSPPDRLGRLRALAVLAAAALLPTQAALAASPPETGAVHTLDSYTNAFCNDGTPGAYYFRKTTTESTEWLFYLQGGEECQDNQGCAARANGKQHILTTSTDWKVNQPHGILSADPTISPLFAGANVVEVHYCSSDFWSGAKSPTTPFHAGNSDTGWYFQGRAIATAAMRDLAARDAATGFSSATKILFSGSSAGGLGIAITLNDLLPLAPPRATRLLAVDAGFTIEINGFDPNAGPRYMDNDVPGVDIITTGIDWWNGHGDTGCWMAAMADKRQQVECYNSGALLSSGFITVPSFSAESELDGAQLRDDGLTGKINQDTAHMTYAKEFARAMTTALRNSNTSNSVFAPRRHLHVMFTGDAEFTHGESFPSGLVSPSEALARWYGDPSQRITLFGNALMPR